MNPDEQKASAFVQRLLKNPAIGAYTPLQKEEQIIQFLHANASQLAPTLESPQFFGGKSREEIFSLIYQSLTEAINALIESHLDVIFDSKVNFDFVSFMTQNSQHAAGGAAEVRSTVEALLERPDARRALTGPLAAVYYGHTRRYLDQIYARRNYIHFELTKVQRLRLGKDHVQGLLDVSMLLKPAIYLMAAPGQTGHGQTTGLIQPAFADNACKALRKRLASLPESVIASAVHSNMSFVEHNFVEATARLSAIFSSRGRNFQQNVRVDRGADSPDKSWFNIARRNYKFYGFDVKVLDEMYSIAAESAW